MEDDDVDTDKKIEPAPKEPEKPKEEPEKKETPPEEPKPEEDPPAEDPPPEANEDPPADTAESPADDGVSGDAQTTPETPPAEPVVQIKGQLNVDKAVEDIENKAAADEVAKSEQNALGKIVSNIDQSANIANEDALHQRMVDALPYENPTSVAADAARITLEFEGIQDELDNASETIETVSDVASTLSQASPSEMNNASGQALCAALEHFRTSLGVRKTNFGMEGYLTGRYTLKAKHSMAMEGIKEFMKDLWEFIIETTKKIGEWIKGFFKWVWGVLTKQRRDAQRAQEACVAAKKKEQDAPSEAVVLADQTETELAVLEKGSKAEFDKAIEKIKASNNVTALILKEMKQQPSQLYMKEFSFLHKDGVPLTAQEIQDLSVKGFSLIENEMVHHLGEMNILQKAVDDFLQVADRTSDELYRASLALPGVVRPTAVGQYETYELYDDGTAQCLIRHLPGNHAVYRLCLQDTTQEAFKDNIRTLKKYVLPLEKSADPDAALEYTSVDRAYVFLDYFKKADAKIEQGIGELRDKIEAALDYLHDKATEMKKNFGKEEQLPVEDGREYPLSVRRVLDFYRNQMSSFTITFSNYYIKLKEQLISYMTQCAQRRYQLIHASEEVLKEIAKMNPSLV
jgi:hypothetical protein